MSGKAHIVLLGTFKLAPPQKQRLLVQPDLPVPGQTKKTGELDLDELSHRIDHETSLLSNVTPVARKLKAAYDPAQEEENDLLNSSEGEGE